jgi:hypothetical protein
MTMVYYLNNNIRYNVFDTESFNKPVKKQAINVLNDGYYFV